MRKATVWIISIYFIMQVVMLEASQRGEAKVRLVDTIAVQAPYVTLGEISSIECDDPQLKQELTYLMIEEVPKVGKTKTISSYKIKSLLARSNLPKAEVFGLQSNVTTETRKVSQEELKEIITAWITKKSDKDIEYEIEFARLAPSWKIPKGKKIEIEIEASNKRTFPSSQNLKLRALSEGRILATTSARVNIDKYRLAVVVERPIKRGEKLEKSDLQLRRAEVTRSKGMEIRNIADVLGMIAKKDLSVGTLLSLNDIDRPTLIERGSINRILIENDGIRMSLSGAKALEHGKKDETILFSHPMNKKETLRARVLRTGLAMIKLK